jgi:hypothetical protein
MGFERKRGASPASNDDLSLNFIVITADEEFHAALRQIAGACEWRIGRAASVDEAGALINARPTAMVVYDRDSTEDNWCNVVRLLSDLPAHPCVLLASQVADSYLLDEVVRNHGYDILPKSMTSERIIQCLRFAWSWARRR